MCGPALADGMQYYRRYATYPAERHVVGLQPP
jgi:hypothetical protein